MARMDFNGFVGRWPFHKVRGWDLDALKERHGKNGICGGYVSSPEAIFYHDPYEADADLSEMLAGDQAYRQVITVNPALPGTCSQVRRALRNLDVAGVRIVPSYHGYDLNCGALDQLCGILAERKLPLFLTLRMVDERTTYLVKPTPVPLWDIARFLQTHTEFPILVCNARLREISWLREVFLHQDNLFADCSGLKDGLFPVEKLYQEGLGKVLVYGSLSPIFCLKSTLLLVEKAQIPDEERELVLSGARFLEKVEEEYRPVVVDAKMGSAMAG